MPSVKQSAHSIRNAPPITVSVALNFDDNRLLAELYGACGVHLERIEHMLNIGIVARGNRLTLSGRENMCHQAAQILQNLYAKLQRGEHISNGDVDGAIRMSVQNSKPQTNSTDDNTQIEMAYIHTPKARITARTPSQHAYIVALAQYELTLGIGAAGTGKTFLAVAQAAKMLASGEVRRIILSRPAVEAGERLGFLPGDMREKIDPYLRPLYDALYDTMDGDKVARALDSGTIEIAPLAFMRGRTLSNAFIILDEAQNATCAQMKMFLTRMGENSRMVITGDPSQSDLPNKNDSGLAEALGILPHVRGVKTIRFAAEDVIRHDLVARIVQAYEKRTPPHKEQDN